MERDAQQRLRDEADEVRVQLRLKELERAGEAFVEERSFFGPLPEIHLLRPVRLDRIIKSAKR
jgi:hypothetical protein